MNDFILSLNIFEFILLILSSFIVISSPFFIGEKREGGTYNAWDWLYSLVWFVLIIGAILMNH